MRWLTFALTAGLLALAFLGFGQVDRQFFPASDRNELIVDFQLPRSSSIFATEAAVERIEDWLAENEDVDFWTSYIGRNVIRFYLPLAILPPATTTRRSSSWPRTSTPGCGWRTTWTLSSSRTSPRP